CIAMVIGYLFFEPTERRRGQYPIFFLLLSTALMIMTARWKRIAEYWPPFADEKTTTFRDVIRTVAVTTVAVVLSVFTLFNVYATKQEISQSESHDFYRKGAEWMRTHVPPGQLIFNTDWDDFPRLFYFDPSHYYIYGLDPSYLFDKDPALSLLYERITTGKEKDPGPLIRERFNSRYVFSDNSHHDFFTNAKESGWYEIVYEDKDCTKMHIR